MNLVLPGMAGGGNGRQQLSTEAIWAIILSAACVKWLRGKVVQPVMHGAQVLPQLPA